MPFRTDLPINYRDEKSSGKRKRELIRSLAGSKGPHAPSHIRVCSHVSARPPHWPCHLLPPLPQGLSSPTLVTPALLGGARPKPLIAALGRGEDAQAWGRAGSWAPAAPGPWGLQGGGGRQETGSLVSIPSLPWGAPSPGRRAMGESWGGGMAPLESVCIKPSGPGLGITCMWEADRRERGASAPAWASGWGCQPQEAVLPGPRGGAPDGEQEEQSPRCPRPSPCWPQGAEVVSHCPLLPLQPDPDV